MKGGDYSKARISAEIVMAANVIRDLVRRGPISAAEAVDVAETQTGLPHLRCEMAFITLLNNGEIATDRELMLVPGRAALASENTP